MFNKAYSRKTTTTKALRTGLGILTWVLGLAVSTQGLAQGTSNPDPWQQWNESMFKFNDYFDQRLVRPAARTYGAVVPSTVRLGIGNFFSNIDDINELLNNLLQAKYSHALSDGGRLVLNSTIGFGGVFDVASELGLEKHQEDFGQTFGSWGVPSGPYMVLPIFGASTLRDSFGLIFDTMTNPLQYNNDNAMRIAAFSLEEIHGRQQLLIFDELQSFDRYLFLREGYLQRRDFLVNDGVIEDEFGSF